VAKVHINGEIFDFDRGSRPMSEMIALEKALDTTYSQWETAMQAGSARALAGLVWLVWRRDGRDVKFSDIESGKVEVEYNTFTIDAEDGAVDPTTPPGSPTTGDGISPRSRRSTSDRGR